MYVYLVLNKHGEKNMNEEVYLVISPEMYACMLDDTEFKPMKKT